MKFPSDIQSLSIAADLSLAVHLQGIERQFGKEAVLDAINLDIPAGQFVALLGASGSGKTTLLRLLAGLDVPNKGTVLVPHQRTIIFQEPRLMPAWPVWRNVLVGMPLNEATKAQAAAVLQEVKLSARADAWPATLSGGEAQRVALARALVREPHLLLMDEPFAALDALTRARMQQLVRELSERHALTTLIVTHDVDEAVLLADRILVLRDGKIRLDITSPNRFVHHEGLKETLINAIGSHHELPHDQ